MINIIYIIPLISHCLLEVFLKTFHHFSFFFTSSSITLHLAILKLTDKNKAVVGVMKLSLVGINLVGINCYHKV